MSATPLFSAAPRSLLTGLAFAALAVVGTAPLLLESTAFDFLPPYAEGWQTWLLCGCVVAAMLLVVGVRILLDRDTEPKAVALNLLFVALAVALTSFHWKLVDYHPTVAEWQRNLYRGLFQHTYEPPHQYRPLPYGFVRSLERLTHDWLFSCLAYRVFFTYWFLWAWYRLARTMHDRPRALLTLVAVIPLYPLSILRYWGQLTDPLSHALLVLSLLYILEERPFALAAALFLGVMAKETAVLVVPSYFAVCLLQGRQGVVRGRSVLRRAAYRPVSLLRGRQGVVRGLVVTVCLGVVAVLAFLASRLPLGWEPGSKGLNGAGFMLGTNLGFGEPIATTPVSLLENYLHPILFIGLFVPFILWNWKTGDCRLQIICVTLTPLVLLSSACYSWLYESRNYVPLLPVVTTLALPVRKAPRPLGERGWG